MLNILITLLILAFLFYFAFLMVLAFFYVSGLISLIFGAPYISLSKKSIPKILLFGGLSSSDVFYDLGCGDGRILESGLYDLNVSKAVGYEIAPWPYFKALFLSKYKRITKIQLFRKNFLKADISQATFIYLYLFPKLIEKTARKITEEGMPLTKILCIEFPIDINKHTRFKLLKSEKVDNLTLYLYELNPPAIHL